MSKTITSVYEHWPAITQAEFNSMVLDFEKFCEKGSMIINKNGEAVKFKLNEGQKIVARAILKEAMAETPRPIKMFIHKSRQMGISVVLGKVEQYLATRIPNINIQHIMPVEADAEDFCEKKFIPLLQGTQPLLLPKTHAIKRRVKFVEYGGKKLDSYVDFTSAENKSGGRSRTNQVVIMDEYAHYESVTYLERGVIATMPKTGRSLQVVVSTAYGMNHFYDMSKVAQDSPHWVYLFLPWHMLAEYEMEPQGRLARMDSLTEYEVKLCDIFEEAGYPIDTWARKMQWYEYTLQTEAKLDQDHMFENYPSTADESFQATGAPVLPSIKLREWKDASRRFDYMEMTQDATTGKVSLIKTNLSTMKQFVGPLRGRRYVIGADPADGGADGDFSAAVVIDLTTMENVFCIKEKLDQTDFAEVLSNLGRHYNNASIVVERNTGQTTIDWLVMLRYPNVFIDALHTTKTRVQYGVYMTPMIKKDAISRAKFLINSGTYKDYDSEFIDEALHFVWKKTPSGLQKAIGSDGYSDDTVMARLIAFASLNMNKFKGYNDGKEQQQI